MRWIRLAAATVNQTPLDWAGNTARIRAALEDARRQGARVVVFPELALTGYGCEDAFHGLALARRAERHLLRLAAEVENEIVGIGLPIRLHQNLYNCLAILAHGEVKGIIAKRHLPGDGVHYEPRWFRPWPADRRTEILLGGRRVPFGSIVLDFGGVRIGAEICEDAWVPNRPIADLADAGVDIVLGPSASHFSFGKDRLRERIVVEGSRAAGAAYVFANALGNEAGRMIFEGQRVIAAGGKVVARGDLLAFREHAVTVAAVDIDLLRMQRGRTVSMAASATNPAIVPVAWEWPEDDAPSPASPRNGDGVAKAHSAWTEGPHRKEEEFARAVALGLFDYLRKSRSGGFVVSLSGGADSAATAALAALAIGLSRKELGEEELARRLPHVRLQHDALCGGLLDTVYQSSANSSDATRNAAAAVARALGARHAEWNIDSMVDTYRESAEAALGRKLTWEEDDVALQNIQSRARAPGVWMIANVRNALLLATSNRSEAAVGYATMDGDTAGSLSPIAGIDKNYLRYWLRWLAETGPEGIGPIPEVRAVCDLPPTAELRPPDRKQTDEADLMPYDLLDAIERLAIRDRLEPGEILHALEGPWAGKCGGREALAEHIRKFFRLWCRNQWKRERYAPSFHLDDENLDPKTWCRFPILSGSFAEELDEL